MSRYGIGTVRSELGLLGKFAYNKKDTHAVSFFVLDIFIKKEYNNKSWVSLTKRPRPESLKME